MPESRILVLHIAGNVSWAVKQLSDEDIVEQVVDSLRRIYPLITNPIKWLVTCWGSDSYSRGSYSSFRVGNEVELLKELVRESHDDRVHWAGELTNNNGSIGYVDNGFVSGQSEAILIHKNLNSLRKAS
ncbi:unnamed protein product [Rotaria sp. Silwood1]|nr:unnamed protein product [Rotaria sp. Silwood1]